MNFGIRCHTFLKKKKISIDDVNLSEEWTFHEVIFPLLRVLV